MLLSSLGIISNWVTSDPMSFILSNYIIMPYLTVVVWSVTFHWKYGHKGRKLLGLKLSNLLVYFKCYIPYISLAIFHLFHIWDVIFHIVKWSNSQMVKLSNNGLSYFDGCVTSNLSWYWKGGHWWKFVNICSPNLSKVAPQSGIKPKMVRFLP